MFYLSQVILRFTNVSTQNTIKMIKIIKNCYGHKQEQFVWTEVLPQPLQTLFTDCVLWTYIMYISSSLCFKEQLCT
jgi:hypothetical protein